MSRLQANQPDAATGKANELLDAVQAKLKITPNMTRVMANSPVLEAYLDFSGALSRGALDAKLQEEIALEVGEQNSCQYCVSSRRTIPGSARATRRLLHNDAYTFDDIAQTMEQFVESLGRPDQDISRVFFGLLESHRSQLSSETFVA
jgi:alkylhydroperoxidase family enzyme